MPKFMFHKILVICSNMMVYFFDCNQQSKND